MKVTPQDMNRLDLIVMAVGKERLAHSRRDAETTDAATNSVGKIVAAKSVDCHLNTAAAKLLAITGKSGCLRKGHRRLAIAEKR